MFQSSTKRGRKNLHLLFVGKSNEADRLRKIVRKVAKNIDNVLFLGEQGTGRAYLARLIHTLSDLGKRPFTVIKCSALGDTMPIKEVFGVKPDESGNHTRNIGLLESAVEGTLFLDEITSLKPEFFSRFLNLITEKKFTALGSEEITPINARIIVSANVNIEEKVARGEFPRDLFNALGNFRIFVPPLRQRRQDIPFLFNNFLNKYCADTNTAVPTLPFDVFEALMAYDWPGNVGELEATVKNLVDLSPGDHLSADFLPFYVKKHPFDFISDKDLPTAVEELEKYLINKALIRYEGNQTKAARLLNISEGTLRYKLKKYGMEEPEA